MEEAGRAPLCITLFEASFRTFFLKRRAASAEFYLRNRHNWSGALTQIIINETRL